MTTYVMLVGNSAPPTHNRGVGVPELQPGGGGWSLLCGRLAGAISPGDRLILMNPFGVDGQTMMLSAYRNAHAEARHLVVGFAASIRGLVDCGVEVVCYLGHPLSDPRFQTTRSAQKFRAEFNLSTGVVVSASASLACDSLSMITPIMQERVAWWWEAVEAFRRDYPDTPIYTEGPWLPTSLAADLPCIALSESHAPWAAGEAPWLAPLRDAAAPVIVVPNATVPGMPPAGTPAWADWVRATGCEPAIPFGWLPRIT